MFTHVAQRLEPAWALWRETSAQFEESTARAMDVSASRDIDAIMAFRIQPDVVALDMASRRIRRHADLANFLDFRNGSRARCPNGSLTPATGDDRGRAVQSHAGLVSANPRA
jgi:hypothetical protein